MALFTLEYNASAILKNFSVKSKVWIDDQNGIFLGKGRIDLLDAVDKCGSISAAAKSMKMSYLKAWKLIQSMNENGPPVVVKSAGGKDGGGTYVTERGKEMIHIYNSINKKCEAFLDKEMKKLNMD